MIFFENDCLSDLEWFETRELLTALYANNELKNDNLDQGVDHITIVYMWGIEKGIFQK